MTQAAQLVPRRTRRDQAHGRTPAVACTDARTAAAEAHVLAGRPPKPYGTRPIVWRPQRHGGARARARARPGSVPASLSSEGLRRKRCLKSAKARAVAGLPIIFIFYVCSLRRDAVLARACAPPRVSRVVPTSRGVPRDMHVQSDAPEEWKSGHQEINLEIK